MTGRRKKQGFLVKMERKYGKYAISGLMKYIAIIQVVGFIINMTEPKIYGQYMSLNLDSILHGQIWRLVTFLFYPVNVSSGAFAIVWFIFAILLEIMMGGRLEQAWGSFRFNVYYFSGIVFTMVGSLLAQGIFRAIDIVPTWQELQQYGLFGKEMYYLDLTLLLAFAVVYSDVKLYLYGILPIKVKWIGIFSGVLTAYEFVQYVYSMIGYIAKGTIIGNFYAMVCSANALLIICSMINFFVFVIGDLKNGSVNKVSNLRRNNNGMKKVVIKPMIKNRHKCTICGKTEKDDENLEFRYCSRCEGNHEYCMEHLFTHEHIKKFVIDINKDITKVDVEESDNDVSESTNEESFVDSEDKVEDKE